MVTVFYLNYDILSYFYFLVVVLHAIERPDLLYSLFAYFNIFYKFSILQLLQDTKKIQLLIWDKIVLSQKTRMEYESFRNGSRSGYIYKEMCEMWKN